MYSTINVTYLEEVCGGSEEIIKEMVSIFLEQIPEFFGEMSNLLRTEKYHDLGLLAHKAKSSVAIMGMDYLAGKLKELELIAKAGENIPSYEDYLKDFKIETDKALEELNTYIKNI